MSMEVSTPNHWSNSDSKRQIHSILRLSYINTILKPLFTLFLSLSSFFKFTSQIHGAVDSRSPRRHRLECLVRLPYNHLSTASLVCPPWKLHLRHPDFLRHRKAAGFTTNIIVMAQSPPQTNTGKAIPPADSYGLTLYEPDSGSWSELPPLPDEPWVAHPLRASRSRVGSGGDRRLRS
ncbi:hypothetical protein CK203_108151 [Vitis vinifera]|uniref:F-box protein n=1 Tax=Vitis vinifera TaxID=29760 RepID=A0A438DJL0_VITVI|nr:hypothetical protein CK203_108151 [Vitis vinifera]